MFSFSTRRRSLPGVLGVAVSLLLTSAPAVHAEVATSSKPGFFSRIANSLTKKETWITIGGAAAAATVGALVLPATASIMGTMAIYGTLGVVGGVGTRLVADALGFTDTTLFGGKKKPQVDENGRPRRPSLPRYQSPHRPEVTEDAGGGTTTRTRPPVRRTAIETRPPLRRDTGPADTVVSRPLGQQPDEGAGNRPPETTGEPCGGDDPLASMDCVAGG